MMSCYSFLFLAASQHPLIILIWYARGDLNPQGFIADGFYLPLLLSQPTIKLQFVVWNIFCPQQYYIRDPLYVLYTFKPLYGATQLLIAILITQLRVPRIRGVTNYTVSNIATQLLRLLPASKVHCVYRFRHARIFNFQIFFLFFFLTIYIIS